MYGADGSMYVMTAEGPVKLTASRPNGPQQAQVRAAQPAPFVVQNPQQGQGRNNQRNPHQQVY